MYFHKRTVSVCVSSKSYSFMKFVQTCRLIKAYQTVFRTMITSKQRVRQRRIGQTKKWVATRQNVCPMQLGVWLASRESSLKIFARLWAWSLLPLAGVWSGDWHWIFHPWSCFTATTLQDLRLTEFRVWKYRLAIYKLVRLKTRAAQLLKSSYTWLKSFCNLATSESFISPHHISSYTVCWPCE